MQALLLATGALADLARPITWSDLRPELPPLADPMSALDFEQRIELETILWVRQMTEADREQRRETVSDAERYERKFSQGGIVVDALLSDYVLWREEMERRQQQINTGLDGVMVTIDGYLLPIAFSEAGMTTFLLVPYVGACIHVPPPPPNQLIVTELPEPLKIKTLFTPVRVTGRMSGEASSQALNLSDGSADVPVGYRLDVVRYEVLTP
ncbi:MAG: DUF3299 domain-containing protein [Hyphomicrobiaceae bacterium]